jgi:eukaryotic-like serine/threonine-protein kinase
VVHPGDVFDDRYELVERLGRGGMAEVFRAIDRTLDREVAVKVLAPDRARDQGFVRRFEREARSAAALNHRNVVGIHDTGEDASGAHYIVMEIVPGPTLEEVIREQGRIEPQKAIAIAQGVCAALEAAHEKDLVHRDIKPGNIMFDAEGAVKVADFGLARAAAEATQTQHVYGSVPYMSPEQARGDRADARSDIYALGCVLYAMLTGEPVFDGDGPLAVIYQHLHATPIPPSELAAGIPPGLEAIVLKCLEKDPADRYPDVVAVHEDLNRVASGRPIVAATPADRTAVLPGTAETVAVAASADRRASEAGAGRGRPGSRRAGVVVLFIAALLAIFAALYFLAEEVPDPVPTPVEQPDPAPDPDPDPEPDEPDEPDEPEEPDAPEEPEEPEPPPEEEEEEEEDEEAEEEEDEEEDGDGDGLPLPAIDG